MNCENCGMPIGERPEDATYEECLCDGCYGKIYPNCKSFNESAKKCGNKDGGYYQADCIGSGVCERWVHE